MELSHSLAGRPPFDRLGPDELRRVLAQAEIAFYPAGTVILEQGGTPATHLYVVHAGRVALEDDGAVLDSLGDGEVFGQVSLLSGRSPTSRVRAEEDTLCYLVPEDLAREVLATPEGLTFLATSLARRVRSHQVPVGGTELASVGSLVHRPPVTCPPGTPVREAAALMAAERVDCLLIPHRDGLGIVTDRDIRARVVAVGRSTDDPVGDVMTPRAEVVDREVLAGEVLLSMLERGFHHFPVAGPGGAIVGVVSDTDLMGLALRSPFRLRTAIERAGSAGEAIERARTLRPTVRDLVEARVDPVDVGRIVAATVDALTVRLIHDAVERLGPPPAPWAWVALGSQARREQALRSDQDHAIVHEGGTTGHDGYFEALAVLVADGLEAAGIARCPAGAMAENALMRRTPDGWRAGFHAWMTEDGAVGSMHSSVLFDHRPLAGDLPAGELFDEAIVEASRTPSFRRVLAMRAVDEAPPTGFLGHVVVEHGGAHSGTLDVKRRGLSLVGGIARYRAVCAGVVAPQTTTRLRAAASAGTLEPDAATGLEEGFRLLWRLRLEHQVRQVRAGDDPDDHLDPSELDAVTRQALRETFRVITLEQRAIASEEGLRPR